MSAFDFKPDIFFISSPLSLTTWPTFSSERIRFPDIKAALPLEGGGAQ